MKVNAMVCYSASTVKYCRQNKMWIHKMKMNTMAMEETCGNFYLSRGHEILMRGHDILLRRHDIRVAMI